MRILAIRFQNLNSLRGTHELNLETGPLAEAGLFAITGPTGAGKSTILDAVTLGLYARSARYGKATAEDMMSRGAIECYATVDFLCESGRYTAKWMLGRTRTGNIKPAIHELSKDGTILAKGLRDVPVMVETLTGLDCDRFLRSVLLAQGQFAKFLLAKTNERADLLERITGSQIYSELGARAYHISAGQTREIEEENIRLGAVTLLSEEERAGINERLAALAAEVAASEDHRLVLTAKVAAAKRAAALCRQSEDHATAAAQHTAAEKDFAPELTRLALHAATLPFADALSALGESERGAQSRAETAMESARKAEAARAEAVIAAGAALAAIAADEAATAENRRGIAEKQQKAAVELAEVDTWLAEHQSDAALAEKLPDLSADVQRVASLAEQRLEAEKKCQAARGTAERTAKEAEQMADKSVAANQHSEKAAREAAEARAALAGLLKEPWTSSDKLEREVPRLANMTESLQRMTAAHAGLTEQQAKITAFAVEAESLQIRAGKLSAEEQIVREKLESSQQTESLLQDLLRQEQLVRSLGEHRAHLEEGKPCPLCGSAEHPWADPARRPADHSTEERLKQHQLVQRGLTDAARKASATKSEADKSLAAVRAQQKEMQRSFEAAQQSLEKEWRACFPDTEFSGDALAAAAMKMAEDHAALCALAEKVRAATEIGHATGKAAERAEGEAKLCRAHAEAGRKNAATAVDAVKEAEGAVQSGATDLADRKKELQTAFLSAGESDSSDAAAALLRVKSRDRAWRETMDSHARLAKQADSLQHELEKSVQHAQTLADRRRETEEAVARANLHPARQPAPEGGWSAVNAALDKAIKDSHAAKSLADSAHESARKAAEQAAEQLRALTAALAGSDFAGVPALRAAQLDAAALKSLTARQSALREAAVRLAAQRENLARDTAALQEEWWCLTEAEGRVALPGEESLNHFGEALAALTTQINSLRMGYGALRQRLDADDAACARHAAAVAELEKRKSAAAPWSRLSELIGSANGDRFSRFAQSITLDHLTALANARLARLCDRYRLLRCGAASELALQISDAWQADAVRPLESLSGGETFLLSLALALGLSELAGGRTRIATLFIDEGFGTLDSTALDIALSALEGLRSGHSTVGIISHVEALKARLTTQVEVTRGPGGWSTLTVKS